MANTTRFAIAKPASSDLVSNGATAMGTIADGFDAIVTGYSQGVFASRPAAGTAGRIYRATDVGTLYFDNGTTWDRMVAGMQTKRGVVTGNLAALGYVDITITWDVAFADTSYTPVVTSLTPSGGMVAVGVKSQTASAIVVSVHNLDTVNIQSATLSAIAIHD